MKKFILDTNVLLTNPEAIYSFQENNVHLPLKVIEEVDKFKKDMNSEIGRNARQFLRNLDKLRERGSLDKGVKLPSKGEKELGTLFVDVFDCAMLLPNDLDPKVPDNIILSYAIYHNNKEDTEVVLVSRDANLRVKADIVGVKAQDYKADKVDTTDLFTGIRTIGVSSVAFNELEDNTSTFVPDINLDANEYLIIRNDETDKDAIICARYDLKKNKLVKLTVPHCYGLSPLNSEQLMALDAIFNPNIKVVTLIGQAGSGKTLLSIAGGLELVERHGKYNKMLVSRPVIPMGKDLGYLPGSIEEKMNPWMQPIQDNLEFLTGSLTASQSLQDQGLLHVEALTYIRGRSIPNQFFILDEAQNLTAHEAKTIITRAGENTKIIMTGDPNQIDNPYVDAYSNGLSHVAKKFKGSELAAHVTLKRGERSPLATLAAELL